jgi:hypothetical protein
MPPRNTDVPTIGEMSILHTDVPTNTVILSKQEQRGEASISLSNVSGRELSVSVHIVVNDPQAEAWITFAGADGQPVTRLEEVFLVGETHHYSVKIAAPPDAKAGRYSFRLRAADKRDPDNIWVDTGEVVFEVVKSEEPPKKSFPWWILIVVLVVLLVVGGVVAFLMLREPPVAPETATPTPTLTLTPTRTPTSTDTPTPTDTSTPTLPAPASIDAFVGTWLNVDPATRSITRVEIRVEGNMVFVHMWGSCTPTDCDWGETSTFTSDANDGVLDLVWDQGFVVRQQQLQLFDNGATLYVATYSVYTDDRSPLNFYDYFSR